LLDHVAEHVQVRVVGHSRLANPPHRRAHSRLRAVDRLTTTEVELVAGTPAARAPLAAELDPLRVLGALADLDHQAHRSAVVRKAADHARIALALSLQALV